MLPGDVAGIFRVDLEFEFYLRRQTGITCGPVGDTDRRHGNEPVIAQFRALEQIERALFTHGRTTGERGGFRRGQIMRLYDDSREPLALRRDRLAFGLKEMPALIVHEPEFAAAGRESRIGTVLTEDQSMLGPARKHAIGLRRAARDEVVDQHADVSLAPRRRPGITLRHRECCIEAGNQPLCRGLLIAGRPVDLSRKVETLDASRLETRLQIARIEEIVFDGVARTRNVCAFEPANAAHEFVLHVERQARRDAVRIDLVRVEALGFDEDLMRIARGKTHDLVLDRGAVARSDAFDDASEERGAIGRAPDNLVCALVGCSDVARELLRMFARAAEKGKHRMRLIAPLLDHHRVIERATVDSWRRTGLESSHAHGELAQALGQPNRRRIARASAGMLLEADVHLAAKKCADSQHDRARAKLDTERCDGATHAPAFDDEIGNFLLKEREIRLILEHRANRLSIERPIGLCSRRAHRRALARIQRAELDARSIGSACHHAAEGIDFLDEMALANAADRRIAAHRAERLDVVRKQERPHAHARRCERAFGAGVAAADDDHVEFLGETHGESACRVNELTAAHSILGPTVTPAFDGEQGMSRVRAHRTRLCARLPARFDRLLLPIAGILVHALYRLISLLAAVMWLAIGHASLLAATTPAIELTDCRLEHPAGLRSVSARCGYLGVAEDPARPDGTQLRLRVAVIDALSKKPAAEPLFVVAGGPGSAAGQFFATVADAFERVRRDRDLVIVDQRGTGLSSPLRCDYVDDFESGQLSLDKVRELTAGCRAGLKARLELYTTSVAVRDLDQVRAALGYRRISLYGASYGTRVVEHYVRRYPERTHAVILDGVVVPEAAIGPSIATDAQTALDRILAACARDKDCAQRFPDLASRFARLLESVTSKPRNLELPDPLTGELQRIVVTRDHLVSAVRLLSYNSVTIAVLPLLLDAAARDDLAPLVAQSIMTSRALADQIWIGMHNSVVCAEDVPFYSPASIDRGALARTYIGIQQLDGLVEICKIWPRGLIDADFHQPLNSKVPALILSGELDPVTPPANGERMAREFHDSLHVIAAGQGHGQLATGCVPRLMAEFLDAGTTAGLDVSCTKAIAALPFFLNFSGPSP